MTGRSLILRGDAAHLPLADSAVDLVVTSPPYFGLRSYTDGGEHYAGQIGAEATPAEFVDALLAVTAECVRVLKPSGSIWVNLGDKYSGARQQTSGRQSTMSSSDYWKRSNPKAIGIPNKSLMGLPWRYALRCIDDLGLILRAEVIWSKPNGLPESVTDRVRRSHEQWFHMVKEPRYFSAVDEVREPHSQSPGAEAWRRIRKPGHGQYAHGDRNDAASIGGPDNPLGKLPGSVWTIPTAPLTVPDHLGVDHFAAFPPEFPRRIILGWSPSGVCVECGQGRRPVAAEAGWTRGKSDPVRDTVSRYRSPLGAQNGNKEGKIRTVTGYACDCPTPDASTTPAVVLDPFGGTGTTAMVARAIGRTGISVDLSADYCRLGQWRTNDAAQRAKVRGEDFRKPEPQIDGQPDLFGGAA